MIPTNDGSFEQNNLLKKIYSLHRLYYSPIPTLISGRYSDEELVKLKPISSISVRKIVGWKSVEIVCSIGYNTQ